MKSEKTLNVQCSMFDVQWEGDARGEEEIDGYLTRELAANDKDKFDLQDRLLEFAARLIKLVDALPASKAGSHIETEKLVRIFSARIRTAERNAK